MRRLRHADGAAECDGLHSVTTKPEPEPEPEKALAGHVVAWLRDEGWDVRQEVVCDGRSPDIVARRGPLLRVVECKMSFGLGVLAQASAWIPFAHSVLVACPKPKRKTVARYMGLQIAMGRGIGVLEVHASPKYGPPPIKLEVVGRMLRRPPCLDLLRAAFDEHPPDFDGPAAGTSGGGRLTPYRRTCETLAVLARHTPGITLRDAMKAMNGHHYASDATARSSMAENLRRGVVHGVEGRIEGRVWRLWPVGR